jgi:hypothetical protein
LPGGQQSSLQGATLPAGPHLIDLGQYPLPSRL